MPGLKEFTEFFVSDDMAADPELAKTQKKISADLGS